MLLPLNFSACEGSLAAQVGACSPLSKVLNCHPPPCALQGTEPSGWGGARPDGKGGDRTAGRWGAPGSRHVAQGLAGELVWASVATAPPTSPGPPPCVGHGQCSQWLTLFLAAERWGTAACGVPGDGAWMPEQGPLLVKSWSCPILGPSPACSPHCWPTAGVAGAGGDLGYLSCQVMLCWDLALEA